MPTIKFPTIDLSTIVSTVKLPFDVPFQLPTIDLPSISLPTVDLPKIELDVDVPDAEQVIEWFRDAVFAGTGLVALTAERVADLQKQFVDLVKTQLKR